MKSILVKAFMASTVIAFGAGSALAAVDHDELVVRLQIVDGCTVNFDMGRDMNLGNYATLANPLQYPSSFSVRCTSSGQATGTAYSVELGAGDWPITAGSTDQRRMKGVNNGEFIRYQIFQGTRPGKIWGLRADGNDITGTRSANETDATTDRHDFLVYVPSQDTPTADYYTDGVTATLTYDLDNGN